MNTPHEPNLPNRADDTPPPPRDELDALLRQWHVSNQEQAAAGRDRLLASLAKEAQTPPALAAHVEPKPSRSSAGLGGTVRRLVFNRYSPLAAAAVVLAVILPFVLPQNSNLVKQSLASNTIMLPEGGRLDAVDDAGNILGPCALKHTDVKADISGRFSRVTVVQKYHNPYKHKIEAVYTFPLSHRAGVDRMTMTIGDRVIEGEVKERETARQIYEAARDSGRVASLLEQERPNIFTQSVANIEPGATIDIQISYVELVQEKDGEFSFLFPTVVGPRYVPGHAPSPPALEVPPQGGDDQAKLKVIPRQGVVLLAPARVEVIDQGPGISRSDRGIDARLLNGALVAATPVQPPANAESDAAYFRIQATYADGSAEPGIYRRDGFGHIGGRWFFCPSPDQSQPSPANNLADEPKPGEPFSQATDQVPDADRITPMPALPGTRAGHDLSISVTIDSGGPALLNLSTPLHKVDRQDLANTDDGQAMRVSLSLANQSEIPNRDFVVKWKQSPGAITERVFAHSGDKGGFFAVQLDPPARVTDADAVPRELIFVVDSSGSMNGAPINACKQLMRKAIDSMREHDRFNVITFAGSTNVLWPIPRSNTPENRAEAMRLVEGQSGAGGTEMMTAIETALRQETTTHLSHHITLDDLANMPADGREVSVRVEDGDLVTEDISTEGFAISPTLVVREGLTLRCTTFALPQLYRANAAKLHDQPEKSLRLILRGRWTTDRGERLLEVSNAVPDAAHAPTPLRVVMFLTDAYVGNDMAIIDAIKRHRGSTRVFSFGIGNSVNRYLIDEMASAGGGESEYVLIGETSESETIAAVDRFTRRTATPVLTNISVAFAGVEPIDLIPNPANIPDLFDAKPLTFLARYTGTASGSMTIRGQTASGPWERTIPLALPGKQTEHSSVPTIWARARIDQLMNMDLRGIQTGSPNPDIRQQIISIGETFNVMSQFTSFVAVDKVRVTVGGQPRLVHVPIELPDQTNWAGFFGDRSNQMLRSREEAELKLSEDAVHTLMARAVESQTLAKFSDNDHEPLVRGESMTSNASPRGAPGALPPPMQRSTPEPMAAGVPAKPSGNPTGGQATRDAAIQSPPDAAGSISAWIDSSKNASADFRYRHPPRSQQLQEQRIMSSPADKKQLGLSVGKAASGSHDYGLFLPQADPTMSAQQQQQALDRNLLLLGATQLARSGRVQEARTLACDNRPPELQSDSDLNALCSLLAADKVDPKVSPTIDEFAVQASRSLIAVQRDETVTRKLATELRTQLPSHAARQQTGTASKQPQRPQAASKSQVQTIAGTVYVAILVTTVDDRTLDALKKAGLRIESTKPDVNLVIGSCDPAALEELALLDEVRRIEPVPATNE